MGIRGMNWEIECPFYDLSIEIAKIRWTPLGPALSVRLIESQIKGVKKGGDQL